MTSDAFTPDGERERRALVVSALRRGTMSSPTWLLCPDAELRSELQFAVAAQGGGFFRVVDWTALAAQLDHRLGLPFAPPTEESERLLVVERALVAASSPRSPLRAALNADPFGVATALLAVVDLLRAHGWDGSASAPPAPSDRVDAVAWENLATLATLSRALTTHLALKGQLDLVARLRRAAAALQGGRRCGLGALWVEGVDRLDPSQRALLQGLDATGCVVHVAPWVQGWPAPSTFVRADAGSLLEALQTGAGRVVTEGDRSVVALRARDVAEEADGIACFIAERVARGDATRDFAVAVSGAAAADRVRRALARWSLRASGAARLPVRSAPLWQVVRAGVRLAWLGPNAMDLSTLLAAPGVGVWGGDRDRLAAALRRAAPGSWRRVRDVVREAMSEREPVAPGAEVESQEAPDPARAQRLAEGRARVDELCDVFERCGPFARHAAVDRVGLLREVMDALLSRFVDSDRFSESLADGRDQTAWLQSARAIEGALRAELSRLEERAATLPADDPSAFLTATESLLGEVEEDLSPPRDEGVAVLDGHASARHRPKVLLVTGFVRGAHPAAPPRRLLLGVEERARVNALLPADDALPDEDQDRVLEWRRTVRLFALPTARLVLVAPRRSADGASVEPSLTWSELLHRLPVADRRGPGRRGIPELAGWLDAELGARVTPRGRRDAAARALGRGLLDEALHAATALSADDSEVRALFAARLRPEREFAVGDLVRARLGEAVLGARDLESALTCRHRFLADALLGLRPLRYLRAAAGPADRSRAVRAALRRIDARLAEQGRVSDDEVELAVDQALEGASGSHFDTEDLRRATRAAVLRYLSLRQAWSMRDGFDAADDEGAAEFELALNNRVIRARATPPRVERSMAGDDGPLLVDFTLRSLDGAARLRDLGLDLDAVLAPLAVEARDGARAAAGYVRFSLAKPAADTLAGRAAAVDDERVAPFETVPTALPVRVERARRIEDHRDRVLADLAAVFDDLDRDDARYDPHDEQEFERLRDGGARTCDRCDAALTCRFRMEGGA